MYTALIDKTTKQLIFSQSGTADHKAMVRDAQSAGITNYEIVELDDAAYAAKIAPAPRGIQVAQATLQDVIDALPADIKARIAAAVAERNSNIPLLDQRRN